MYSFYPIEEFGPDANISINYRYDLLITCSALEERGEYSDRQCRAGCNEVKTVYYDSENLSLLIDEQEVSLFDFFESRELSEFRSILFDATNLGFAEILILLRHLVEKSAAEIIGFFYSEPLIYKDKVTTPNQVRAFDLSEKVNDIDIIPSFYSYLDNENGSYLLAFLGFEEVRLSRALNTDEGNEFGELSVAFTVPPFQTGWESHALMANSLVLEGESNLRESFFVSGNQYVSSYKLIEEQKRYAGVNNRILSVAPLGAKPSSIAVALAAASDRDINVLYDFPKRKSDRSSGVGRSHHYRIKINR